MPPPSFAHVEDQATDADARYAAAVATEDARFAAAAMAQDQQFAQAMREEEQRYARAVAEEETRHRVWEAASAEPRPSASESQEFWKLDDPTLLGVASLPDLSPPPDDTSVSTALEAVRRARGENPSLGSKNLVAEVKAKYPNLEASGVKVGSREVREARKTLDGADAGTSGAQLPPHAGGAYQGCGDGGEVPSTLGRSAPMIEHLRAEIDNFNAGRTRNLSNASIGRLLTLSGADDRALMLRSRPWSFVDEAKRPGYVSRVFKEIGTASGDSLDTWLLNHTDSAMSVFQMPQGAGDARQRVVRREGVLALAGGEGGLKYDQFSFEHQHDASNMVVVYVVKWRTEEVADTDDPANTPIMLRMRTDIDNLNIGRGHSYLSVESITALLLFSQIYIQQLALTSRPDSMADESKRLGYVPRVFWEMGTKPRRRRNASHNLDKWNFKGGRAGKRFLEMPQGLVDENQRIVCRRGVIQIAGQTHGLRFQQYRFEHQRDATRKVTVYVVPLCEVVSVRARTDTATCTN